MSSMTALLKKELQAHIQSIDIRIARLKHLQAATTHEADRNRMDLQKLEATRAELLEKVKSAPE
jgi:hypothetical protein